jgi:WXXGXW repeat (2 copies)
LIAYLIDESAGSLYLNTSWRRRVSLFHSMLHLKMNTKLTTIALAALLFAGLPLASSSAQVGISVAIAPPAIPVYEQPLCPAPGYLWTPGYWAYADFGYYWVPGVWVAPPRIGFLWTPGYWGYRGGGYYFNQGYWGPTVGFYGGINYGYGYGGRGYYGGEWAGNTFRYNTAVTRVNTTVVHNTYVNNKVVTNTGSRAGYNGPGGAQSRATAQEQAAAKGKHIPPTQTQRSRVEAAKNDPALHATNNQGNPKSDAVQTFDRQHGKQATATAGGAAEAKQQARTGKQAGAEKAKGGTAQAANASHQKATTARTREGTTPNAHKTSLAKNSAQTNKKATTPHKAQHPPTAQHRPQTPKAKQPTSAPHGRAPAKGEEPGKKKNKHPGNGPGGQ